ncbi:homoserine kinase [Candidatus Poribacteria bacterium]|nr:homoserine kinase [Candidatus Poribacteria bacterium]
MSRKVSARIPASTTNLGPGFDVLGLALKLYSTVTLETTGSSSEVVVSGVDVDKIPSTPEHIAFQAVQSVFQRSGVQQPKGLKLSIANGIPAIRGLGGSGTAILGGLLTANVLCGNPFSYSELLNFATAMEGHPDNVAASLYGGMVISVQEGEHIHTIQLECDPTLHVVLAIPEFTLSTQKARNILPKTVDFADAIYNISRSSLLVACIATGKLEMLSVAMKDKLHQPYRSTLIPGFDDVVDAATDAGAVSIALSGAGPTIAAYCLNNMDAVGNRMRDVFKRHNIPCKIQVIGADLEGAKVWSNGDESPK